MSLHQARAKSPAMFSPVLPQRAQQGAVARTLLLYLFGVKVTLTPGGLYCLRVAEPSISAKVTHSAVENAASTAAMILTTEALVTEIPELGMRNKTKSTCRIHSVYCVLHVIGVGKRHRVHTDADDVILNCVASGADFGAGDHQEGWIAHELVRVRNNVVISDGHKMVALIRVPPHVFGGGEFAVRLVSVGMRVPFEPMTRLPEWWK